MRKFSFTILSAVFIFISALTITLTICLLWGLFLDNLSREIPSLFSKTVYLKRIENLEKQKVLNAVRLINFLKQEKLKEGVKDENEVKKYVLKVLKTGFSRFGYPDIFIIKVNLNNKKCQGEFVLYTIPIIRNHTCLTLKDSYIRDANGKPCLKKCYKELIKKGSLLTTVVWPYSWEGSRKRVVELFYYKPFNWVIGADAPVNFEVIFPNFSKYLRSKFFQYTKAISIISLLTAISLGVLIWLLLFLRFMYTPLKNDIANIKQFFEEYPKSKRIDIDRIKIEEVREIVSSINKLLGSIEQKNSIIQKLLDRYTSLMQNIPEIMFVFKQSNGNLTLEETNKEGLDSHLFGVVKDNTTPDELFKDAPDIAKSIKTVAKNGHTTHFVVSLKKKALTYFLVRIYKVEQDRVVCLLRNITSTVNAFKTVERNRNLMGDLLNNIKAGIMVINERGKIVFLNSFAKELLGISKRDQLLKKVKLPESIKFTFIKVLHGREICDGCEIELATASGLKKWFSIHATPIKIGKKKMIIVSMNDITQKQIKSQQLEYLSFHDSLTGLYNRRFFEEELHRLFNKRSIPLGLILIDLNGLKIINDMLGHKMGDKFLVKIAEILSTSIRASDISARIGGDEFAIILPNTTEEGVKKLISRIEERIEATNRTNEMFLSISVGYAIHFGQFKNAEELFKAADDVLYKNKYSKKRRLILMDMVRWASEYSSKKRDVDKEYLVEREKYTPPNQ